MQDWEPSQGKPQQVAVGRAVSTESVQKYIAGRWNIQNALYSPCRKIVFTITSHDQGWGGDYDDRGTYRGSWTWFEAGLERFDEPDPVARDAENQAEPAPLQDEQPAVFHMDNLHTVWPELQKDRGVGFEHVLLGSEDWLIQRNLTATSQETTHRVVWRHSDDIPPESTRADAKLQSLGRGKGTGDGHVVRNLRLGDVITVWGKARFGGWSNHVESLKVQVYWVI
jgi:hypothetical protein